MTEDLSAADSPINIPRVLNEVRDDDAIKSSQKNQIFYNARAKQFVELHDQVEASVNLLDSLETFLSTFQKDLSAVSGQISELQDRSKDIDSRLKSRKKIEKPLSSLLSDLCIPPKLATLILDTDVGEPWLSAIGDFEQRLKALAVRKRVKAARDLAEVAEGLRIVAATKLRAFFLSIIQPIRSSMSTNMQVLQTSILVKYKPLYDFLQRHASTVAQEVQRAYVAAARVYYETGFRRYVRSLGVIKARVTEKAEPITSGVNEKEEALSVNEQRLAMAKIQGAGVTLGYMADDKAHKETIEALFRSLLLVLMDNATSENLFISTFFSEPPLETSIHLPESYLLSPTSAIDQSIGNRRENDATDLFPTSSTRANVLDVDDETGKRPLSKEEKSTLNAMWKQVMEPALGYCEKFASSVLDQPPPVTSLLTMIRLNESVILEVQKRECTALESFVFGLRLHFWPVFQKMMTDHIGSLNKFADAATAGYFKRGAPITDIAIQNIANRYVSMFTAFVILTDQEDETMIFSNLQRLRQELTQMVVVQSKRISDTQRSARYQSTVFEAILRTLSSGPLPMIHPKAQTEIAFWRQREEEARRRISSTNSTR
ncbi:Vps52-domain-containing protein [Rickenella mellea]|uniref:Vps52-domain-containing protein n=1 Tax=Rickenella mellea TaxID=50990 RepID=A0A4R5XE75_9AGAM|nr:Vps52-domain-containing protein [Rickenella mellea]